MTLPTVFPGNDFTPQEKADVLKYLGFADWQAMAQSIQLGFPASSQPLFLVRDAFFRISPEGRAACRQALCNLQAIDAQRSGARDRFKVSSVGEVKMRENEIDLLEREYTFWTGRLADSFGVDKNQYSVLFSGGMGGINRSVIG